MRRWGDLTFWMHEAALANWHAPRRTTPGGQPRYSDLAIELVLTWRLVFHLALRPAEGFACSVLALLGLDLAAPDHTTLSRRGRAFADHSRRVRTSRMGWQRPTGYSRRNHAETTMSCYKHLIGPKLRARTWSGQQGQVALAVQVLNRMIRVAKPITVRRT